MSQNLRTFCAHLQSPKMSFWQGPVPGKK